MDPYTLVCKTSEIEKGSMKKYEVKYKPILIVNIDNMFYALSAKCTHMGGDLSQGTLLGECITCPIHHSKFNAKDGSVIRWVSKFPNLVQSLVKVVSKPTNLPVYSIKVENGNILVKVS